MTTIETETLLKWLNSGDPGKVAAALQKIKVGDIFDQIDETITIASGTAINLATDSAAKRAALVVQSVRVVTGTATGLRQVGDAGATPSTTVCTLSADGKTITFEAAITVARIVWVPRPDVDVDAAAVSTP